MKEIEFPIIVNGNEEISKYEFKKRLGQCVCDWHVGQTTRHLLVDMGLAKFSKDMKSISPTLKGKRLFYEMVFHG